MSAVSFVVEIDLVVTDNFFVYPDDSFKGTQSVRVTATNPANGNSVIVSNARQRSGQAIVDEAAGTITFVTSLKGLDSKIQTGHGSVLLRDAGFIQFVDTFDLATGELLSSEVIVKGPHPGADSDSTLFCGVISEALA